MAKKRISEDQIKKILQAVADGAKPTVLAKKHGFSLGTYYNWKNKYGLPKGKGVAPAKKRGRPAKAKAAPAPAKKRGRPAKAKAAPAAAKRRGRPAKAKAAPAPAKRRGRPAKAKAAPAASKTAAKIAKVVATYEARLDKLNKAYAAALLKAAK